MSALDDYLKLHIEGYLLGDLKRMAEIKLRPGETMGAAGYPMVQTTITGIESLGLLLADTPPKKKNDGQAHFTRYWQQALYPNDSRRRGIVDYIYSLVRNGVAHNYATKGEGIFVTKFAPTFHFTQRNGRVFIDATEFAAEFKRSYDASFKRRVESERHRMEANLSALLAFNDDDVTRASSHLNVLPPAPEPPPMAMGFDLESLAVSASASMGAMPFNIAPSGSGFPVQNIRFGSNDGEDESIVPLQAVTASSGGFGG